MLTFEKKINEILKEYEKSDVYDLACTIRKVLIGDECLYGEGCKECGKRMLKLLLEKYKEPIKLSRLEYEVLKRVNKQGYVYLARNARNLLYSHVEKPHKLKCVNNWSVDGRTFHLNLFDDLFQFVKWEDEEPTLIDDILDNCEIIEEEK